MQVTCLSPALSTRSLDINVLQVQQSKFSNSFLTFSFQVDEYANCVANFLYEAGFRQNDVVAIFMENRPEFVCIWMGMAKVGVVASLINFNLRNESLAHCIDVCDAKAVIYGSEMAQGRQMEKIF